MILEMEKPIETEHCIRSGGYTAWAQVSGRTVIAEGGTAYQARTNLFNAAADSWLRRIKQKWAREDAA